MTSLRRHVCWTYVACNSCATHRTEIPKRTPLWVDVQKKRKNFQNLSLAGLTPQLYKSRCCWTYHVAKLNELCNRRFCWGALELNPRGSMSEDIFILFLKTLTAACPLEDVDTVCRAWVEAYINATGEFSVCMYVCMYVCLRHTYIHTYSLFARRINIDFNSCAPRRIEIPKRVSVCYKPKRVCKFGIPNVFRHTSLSWFHWEESISCSPSNKRDT